MSKFTTVYTWNGALSYASPDPSGETSGRLSLFFKGVRGLEVSRLYEYLRDSANESLLDTFLLAFHLRDCRGGKGERELGRRAFIWLFINYPVQFRNVLPLIAEYGRWDDLIELFPGMLKLEYTTPESEYLQFLQNEVVQLVATQLRTDRAAMLIGKPCSLCAKWTPTEGDRHDRKTGVFRTLAAAVGVSARSLRKNYNTPLRTYIKIVERYMCSGQWEEIDFNKVPSQAMKRLKKAFEKHQPEKYAVWRNALKLGYTKVNAKQLHPHELVREMRSKNISDPVTEAQWKILAEEVHKLGSLKDAVVVVDTSLSMCSPNYIPLDVAIAMGMLISDMVQGPFHGHVITFGSLRFEICLGVERLIWKVLSSSFLIAQLVVSCHKKTCQRDCSLYLICNSTRSIMTTALQTGSVLMRCISQLDTIVHNSSSGMSTEQALTFP